MSAKANFKNGTISKTMESVAVSTPWKSVYVASFCALLQEVQFTIFLSSMWPYLKKLNPMVEETQYGIVNACFSFGAMISTLLFGYWSNQIKQVRFPLLVGSSLMMTGSIIYLSLQFFPPFWIGYVMMASRLITGCGSANIALLKAYALTVSSVEDRSKAIACVGGGMAGGSLIGPALQLFLAVIGPKGITVADRFQLNLYNIPAVIALLLNLTGFLVIRLVFEENYRVIEEQRGTTTRSLAVSLPCFIALFICTFTRFVQEFAQSTAETLGPPFTMLMFLFDKREAVTANSTAQLAVGCVSAVMYFTFFLINLSKRVSPRIFVIVGLYGYAVLYLLTFPWPFISKNVEISVNGSDAGCNAYRFTWCDHLTAVSPYIYYPLYVIVFGCVHSTMNVAVTTIFSQAIGPRRQGTSQGIFLMVGSCGKLLAPLVMSVLYTMSGPKLPWIAEIVQFHTMAFVWILFYKKMIPFRQ